MTDEYSVLIKNATIVDGTGSPAYKGTVGVAGERISFVGKTNGEPEKTAEKVLDAKGHIVSPGFIDVHNHGDISIIYYPKADGFLRQGITTFVGGNCGSSPAPYGELVNFGFFLHDLYEELSPDMYYPHTLVSREVFNEKHAQIYGWEVDWYTMGDFFNKLEKKGISPNYVPLLGHNPVRLMVMGHDYERKATLDEIKSMKPMVKQAMEDGCRGISVGRDYEPSYYADFEELVALASVAAEYGGVYTCHSLRTGLRKARRPGEFPPIKVNGLLEAIDVGRKAKIPVQISHLGSLYDVTPGGSMMLNEASARSTLKMVDDARAEGIDVTFDMIPGIRGYGTSQSVWLVTSLLPWLKLSGGSRIQFARALRMKQFREEIKHTIWSGKWYSLNPNINPNWARGQLIMSCKEERFVNKTVEQIAGELGIDPLDALMDVLMIDPYTKIGSRGMDNPVKHLFYQHPASMVGIDTLAIDTTWETKTAPWSKPSENSFNGFAYYFSIVVRQSKILSIEEAVRKVTSLPAKKFKLRDRGVLKEGAYADIVIMDIDHVAPKAEPLNPCLYPEGIEHVLVNGTQVIENSAHTGALPGKILRRE